MRLWALVVVAGLAGCPDGAGSPDAPTADRHAVADLAILVDQSAPADATSLDFGGPQDCGDKTCGSGQICVVLFQQADPTVCIDIPAACGGVPNCNCVTAAVCPGFCCQPLTGRSFRCISCA